MCFWYVETEFLGTLDEGGYLSQSLRQGMIKMNSLAFRACLENSRYLDIVHCRDIRTADP